MKNNIIVFYYYIIVLYPAVYFFEYKNEDILKLSLLN